MRIAALASREMIQEIRGKRTAIQPEWIWLKSIQDLNDSVQPDAIFDFEFSYDQERINILAQHLPNAPPNQMHPNQSTILAIRHEIHLNILNSI